MSMIALRPRGIKSAPPRRPAPKRRPNPRDAWPAWTDRVVVSVPPEPDEPRPTAGPDYTPGPAAVAWNDGYSVGLAGIVAAVPASEMPEACQLAWWVGRNAGWAARGRRAAGLARWDVAPGASTGIRDSDIYPPGCPS